MESFLNWLGTVISIVGALVSIWQSFKVKKYRKDVNRKLRQSTVFKANEYFKSAQRDCRNLLSMSRGQNVDDIYSSIQENIDLARQELNQESQDSDLFQQLEKIDKELKEMRRENKSADNLHVTLSNIIITCNQITGEIS